MPSLPLLDRSFLERLERLTLQWQKSFAGLVGGHNNSRFAGAGQEFLDHRNFHHGDDLRAVNWRAYLRLEKLFLKMFQVEPRVPVRLLLDTSVSMAGATDKFDYARKLAGALCYIGLVRLDTMEIHPFSQRLAQRQLCTGGRHRFASVLECLSNLKAEGVTDYFNVAREFITSNSMPGLLIVISDFLDDRGCEKPLQYLADFGHELMLVQIWSDEDRCPPWSGDLDLFDAETHARLTLQFDDAARKRYTAAFDEFSDGLRQLALRNSGKYVGVPTSMPIEEVVFGPMVRSRGIA